MIETTDIYKIAEVTNTLQKKFMDDINEDTLSMGMFGYINEKLSRIEQNVLIKQAEWGNEAFPTRSKFDKNILTYAMIYNIENINAIPAYMEVMIGFIEDDLVNNMISDKITIDKDCPIKIGDFEFHIDYDLVITRNRVNASEVVYSAMYNIDRINKLSNIVDPNIEPPIYLNINGSKFVFVRCFIRQVEHKSIYKKIISTSVLENKIIEFEFDSQLATFEIIAKESTGNIYLTPIFEGTPTNGLEYYCYYSFIDSNNIRIKFERDSYEPSLNTEIECRLKLTMGSEGSFPYTDDILQAVTSERFEYKNLNTMIKPLTDSLYGTDRKSKSMLQEIIPKEILSRGNITCNKDLENFFDNIDSNKLKFYPRRDNQQERLYYAYMLVKDNEDNIIPTNTINLSINQSEFDYEDSKRYTIYPGKLFSYENELGVISTDNTNISTREKDGFLYTNPFLITLNKYPFSLSYYLTTVNDKRYFKFSYINQNSSIQFISSNMHCYRSYLDDNKYHITMDIQQNVINDNSLVTQDMNGNIIDSKIAPIILLNNGTLSYYKTGNIVTAYGSGRYKVEFILDTVDNITIDNRIRINNVKVGGSDAVSYGYFHETLNMSVYIFTKFDNEYGRDNTDAIIPNMIGYTLCNRFDTQSKINLFYNYSDIVRSTAIPIDKDDNYKLKSVPMVRYSYIENITRNLNFIEFIQYRKLYIDEVLKVLEDSFSIDLKFFNTYGPSKMFTIGHDEYKLDKVNLSLNFRLHLKNSNDKAVLSLIITKIKEYVENINEITSIHMTNLTTEISNQFKYNIDFIEFLGINKYNALLQYVERHELDEVECVPEFLNINLLEDSSPDINIELV